MIINGKYYSSYSAMNDKELNAELSFLTGYLAYISFEHPDFKTLRNNYSLVFNEYYKRKGIITRI